MGQCCNLCLPELFLCADAQIPLMPACLRYVALASALADLEAVRHPSGQASTICLCVCACNV